MGTTILSFQNRVVIETLHSEGRSLRYIANYLGFSKATIFNELHRLNPPAPTANGSGFVLTTQIIPYGITS